MRSVTGFTQYREWLGYLSVKWRSWEERIQGCALVWSCPLRAWLIYNMIYVSQAKPTYLMPGQQSVSSSQYAHFHLVPWLCIIFDSFCISVFHFLPTCCVCVCVCMHEVNTPWQCARASVEFKNVQFSDYKYRIFEGLPALIPWYDKKIKQFRYRTISIIRPCCMRARVTCVISPQNILSGLQT